LNVIQWTHCIQKSAGQNIPLYDGWTVVTDWGVTVEWNYHIYSKGKENLETFLKLNSEYLFDWNIVRLGGRHYSTTVVTERDRRIMTNNVRRLK